MIKSTSVSFNRLIVLFMFFYVNIGFKCIFITLKIQVRYLSLRHFFVFLPLQSSLTFIRKKCLKIPVDFNSLEESYFELGRSIGGPAHTVSFSDSPYTYKCCEGGNSLHIVDRSILSYALPTSSS